MKALVVGLGSIGARHLNNLHTLGVEDLSVLRTRNLPPPTEIPKNVRVFQDYEQALFAQPDFVVIANPTAYHLPFAQKALGAHCHLYLEKPLSHNLEGTAELLQLAKTKKRIVAVGCQFRFDPNLEQIQRWLLEDQLGTIFSVVIDMGEYLPAWHPWEDYRESYSAREDMGGGVILTLIHELDYPYWLFGPVKRVFAMGGQLTPLEMDVEDTALISLYTKTGLPIQLRMDYWRKPPVRKMHIVGERGEIFWDYYKGETALVDRAGKVQICQTPESWERNSLFLATMKNFLEAIENKAKVRTSLAEGIAVLKIALSAKTSIREQTVVQL